MAKQIKILKHFNCYNPGEVAQFDDDVAEQIVERKFGVEVKADKKGKAVAEGENQPEQK
jgi:hypothetical protein